MADERDVMRGRKSERRIYALAIAVCTLTACAHQSRAGCDEAPVSINANQVGFFTDGRKLAVISSPARTPLEWRLMDASGEVRLRGRTDVLGDDPVAGDHVHLADFSDYRQAGPGYRIETACARSHAFDIGSTPYGDLKYDALAYFYHNRSGIPIQEPFAGGTEWARPAGHERDTATCRKGRDRFGNRWPGCDYTLDLTGGWYDAGDHGKYVVNGGISVWTLLNLYERQQLLEKGAAFADGHTSLPEAGNGVNDLLDEARFELEFLLRMQAPEGATAKVPVDVLQNRPDLEFSRIDASGMAHHKISDENWTPLPMPPHLDEQRRVLFPVSTAATLNLAATAAQCARIWRDIDPGFSRRCLDAATRAWSGAIRNPGVYFIADFSGSGTYGDSKLDDEFFWAAAELFVTTGERGYLDALRDSSYFRAPITQEPAWPRVAQLGVISLALVPNDLPRRAKVSMRNRIVAAANRFRDERLRSGYRIPYATERYAWGSNSNVLNRAILLALAHDFTGDIDYRNAAIDAMDYILGRNPLGQSYISGYGKRAMQNPHHRFWAPSADDGLPGPPPGALSGGPNSLNPADEVAAELVREKCAPQRCWRDDIRAYSLNEVAINWNAPLVWVAAFLDEQPVQRPMESSNVPTGSPDSP